MIVEIEQSYLLKSLVDYTNNRAYLYANVMLETTLHIQVSDTMPIINRFDYDLGSHLTISRLRSSCDINYLSLVIFIIKTDGVIYDNK